MLLKLLKYEIRSSYARILAAFAAYTAFFLVTLIFFRYNSLMLGILILLGVVGLPVVTLVTIFQRYNDNLYHSEGYLMFALPVGGKTLLASKALAAVLWSLLLTLTSCAYFAVSLLAAGRWGALLADLAEAALSASFWVRLGVGWMVSLFLGVLEIDFAISFSKLPVFRKFGVPVGLASYFVLNFLPAAPMLLYERFRREGAAGAGGEIVFADVLRQIIPAFSAAQTAVDFAFAVGLFFATAWLLEKKTNLK